MAGFSEFAHGKYGYPNTGYKIEMCLPTLGEDDQLVSRRPAPRYALRGVPVLSVRKLRFCSLLPAHRIKGLADPEV